MDKLTEKQEKFCNYYIETGNKSEAYRRAYNCSKMKPESINRKAVEMMNHVKVSARISELQSKQQQRSDITKDRILQEFEKIAFSSIAYLHNTWIERVEFEKLTDDQKSSIKSISTKMMVKNVGTKDKPEIINIEYVKIELYDKIKALENINKMLGYEAPTKNEVTGKDGTPLLSQINVKVIRTKQEADKLKDE